MPCRAGAGETAKCRPAKRRRTGVVPTAPSVSVRMARSPRHEPAYRRRSSAPAGSSQPAGPRGGQWLSGRAVRRQRDLVAVEASSANRGEGPPQKGEQRQRRSAVRVRHGRRRRERRGSRSGTRSPAGARQRGCPAPTRQAEAKSWHGSHRHSVGTPVARQAARRHARR